MWPMTCQRFGNIALILFIIGLSSAASTQEIKCPRGYYYTDGCANAPSGTVQYPHLLRKQRVNLLNINPGSGYTDGLHSWVSQGGGCTTPATGTVRVVGGQISATDYTITNHGAGCTSRPTIVASLGAGAGGRIVPTVYQKRPPWNVPGVDYYVGLPAGTVLRDPTVSANLPHGASYSAYSHMVTISTSNVTLDGFDFCTPGVNVYVNGGLTGTVIQNSLFCANLHSQNGQNIRIAPGNGHTTIQKNEFDGKAIPHAGSGMDLEQAVLALGHGILTFQYNYCHDVDSKCLNVGTSVLQTLNFVERYNAFVNVGLCQTGCAHGESEYFYGGNCLATIVPTIDTNLYVTFWQNASTTSDQTSEMAVEADAINVIGGTVNQNTVMSPGPWGNVTANGRQSLVIGSDLIFYGQQEGGTMTGTAFTKNYLDFSGAYFPWYPEPDAVGLSFFGNKNMETGHSCNPSSCD